MSPRADKNFHVPLTPDLHRRLHAAARRASCPATAVARDAIERFLAREEREAIRDEMRLYAEAHAGQPSDLEPDLETAGIETLLLELEEE